MQDIHHIDAGRIFSGGGDGGDRRLRTDRDHYQIQALKCPRCDSRNTKFCYFNNYNLSQPRHFCKSCRRYWTKGGVLRNVPVGGGCRKSSSKHSSSSASKSSNPSKESTPKPKSKSSSNSSSESSCLSGTRAAAAVPSTSAATPDAVSSSANRMFGFSDTKYIFPSLRNTNFSSELMNGTNYSGGFTDIGNISNLMTSSSINVPPTGNEAASYESVAKFHMNPQENSQMEHWQLSEVADAAGVCVDPTVQIDRTENNRSEPLDWQQQERQMFGLASAVDQGYWWSQQQMFGSW